MYRTYQVLNIAGLLTALALNWAANALPLNGKNTGELSALYPNLFVPTGFTFAIWGLIYLLLIGFAIYQASDLFSAPKPRVQGTVMRIGPWFLVSCLANAGWILAWHYLAVGLSLAVMLVLLGSLLAIYLRLGIGRPDTPAHLLVRATFGIYLGWISVATIANATALLVHLGWDGLGISEAIWAAALIATAALIGWRMLATKRDVFFAGVLLWAFYGIFSRQSASGAEGILPIYIALATGAAVLLLSSLYYLRRA